MLAGKKLKAVEACDYGLVTEVFPQAEFEKEVNKRVKYMAGLPHQVCVTGEEVVTRNKLV